MVGVALRSGGILRDSFTAFLVAQRMAPDGLRKIGWSRRECRPQADAGIGEVIKRVMGIADDREKPFVIEKLDPEQKKRQLEGGGVKRSRMLS